MEPTMDREELSLDDAVAAMTEIEEDVAADTDVDDEAQLAEDDTGVDDEADASDEDDSGESPEEDEAEAEDEVYTWETKAGEKIEATLAEMQFGFMRERDYRRKTMDHADAVRAFEEQQRSRTAELEARQEKLEADITHWAVNDPFAKVDWMRLSRENPARYVQMRAQADAHQEKMAAAKTALAEMKERAQQEAFQAAQTRVLQDFPELSSPDAVQKMQGELASALSDYKISEDTFAELVLKEPGLVRMALEAGQVRKAAKNPAQIEKRVTRSDKTLSPGAKTTANQRSSQAYQEKRKRFHKTGSVEDAVGLLLASGL